MTLLKWLVSERLLLCRNAPKRQYAYYKGEGLPKQDTKNTKSNQLSQASLVTTESIIVRFFLLPGFHRRLAQILLDASDCSSRWLSRWWKLHGVPMVWSRLGFVLKMTEEKEKHAWICGTISKNLCANLMFSLTTKTAATQLSLKSRVFVWSLWYDGWKQCLAS